MEEKEKGGRGGERRGGGSGLTSMSHLYTPESALLLGLVKNELRGNLGSPGISKLETASVAKDFWPSLRLGH